MEGQDLSPGARARLIASINAGRLIIVCGAGLSVAAPSNLPSAASVSDKCFEKYRLTVDPNINPDLRYNLEALAEYFAARNELETIFINSLVPWNDFVRPYNAGHSAVADFLMTGAAVAAISSNYDTLIERQVWDYGADFRASLDGGEANIDSAKHSPLLKFHGCGQRDRSATIWAPSQLQAAQVTARLASSKAWIDTNLQQRDLLVVGFWSDWDYLNQVIGNALGGINPVSVTVIDPSTSQQLQTKAPGLWALAHGPSVTFEHVQESGASALNELRREFSRNYMRQVLNAGAQAFQQSTGVPCPQHLLEFSDMDSESIYGWRRDAEGKPAGSVATKISPQNCDAVGLIHLLLKHSGALPQGAYYNFNGQTVRVVNAANSVLSTIKQSYIEAPSGQSAEIVVAVGALDLGLPANVVRDGRPGDVIRPAPGGEWLDTAAGKARLGL